MTAILLQTIRKINKMAATLNFTILKPNFNGSDFECLVFDPPLDSNLQNHSLNRQLKGRI